MLLSPRPWPRLILLVASLCMGPAHQSLHAQGDGLELQFTSDDQFIQIWSDHTLDQDRSEWIAERVYDAYEFVSEQEAWRDEDILWSTPLQVRVVRSIRSGVLGYAQPPNVFVVEDDYLDNPLSEGTLAHELTHVQDGRQLRGAKLPSFVLEGRALTNGHEYRMALGQDENDYDRQMAESAAGFTSADADAILDEFYDVGWKMQAMGTFLVEYMRTTWNGRGVPDIHPRLSRMIETMAGGVDVEAAFETEFGVPATALLESFGEFLDRTQNDPAGRLQGMMWAPGLGGR